MNHKSGFNALSRNTSHRRAMLRNMATSLFRYERITTTKAKAREVRKCAEKLITRAKVDNVHSRREVAKFIQDEIVLAKLFTNIAPRMNSRAGGYTRMFKLGFRQGDAADIVILELVDYQLDGDKKASKDKKADEKKTTSKKTNDKKASTKKAPKAEKPAKVEKVEEPKAADTSNVAE